MKRILAVALAALAAGAETTPHAAGALGIRHLGVAERLLPQALLRFEHVTMRSPAMGRAPRDLAVPEMSRCRTAMLCGEVQLGGGLVVQLHFRL